jgi:uncharacterized protein YciW
MLVRWLWDGGARAARLAPAAAAELLCGELDGFAFLDVRQREILRYVCWLTLSPRRMTAAHLAPLSGAGLTDDEIHDVVHVVCCFSYMNRLADGLGVSILADREPLAIELFGAEALATHRAWAEAGAAR